MAYPRATEDDIAFFREHGWIAVQDAIDPADLATLEARCQVILDRDHYPWKVFVNQVTGERTVPETR